MARWPWQHRTRTDEGRKARIEAERQLERDKCQWKEVHEVASSARNLRINDEFGGQITGLISHRKGR